MEHRLLDHLSTKSKAGLDINAHVTTMTKTPLLVSKFNCIELPKRLAIQFPQLNPKTTTTVLSAATALGLKGFTRALATFVLIERAKRNREVTCNNKNDWHESDLSWLDKYPIQFFGSLRCLKRSGKDETNSEAEDYEFLRCSPD